MSCNISSFVKNFIGVNYFAPRDMIYFSIVFSFLSDMLFISHKFNCTFMKKVVNFIIFIIIPNCPLEIFIKRIATNQR